ncbi:MAG TPA: Lrp/AsnC ligand binding domain-containing protein [Candidatus Nitrosotalea sp.]|nr:Lrp/AsnC ligand binding domain-containing protein [Nitrososphaerota archaeon]HKU32317.1 Lrp/AsnC ligand binding domain-containing protein [Candidatus Nitrosotalea sp.]
MPTTYILINSDLGSDMEIIKQIKDILNNEAAVKYEIQGVYGVYDIIVKITADSMDRLRSIITNKIRKIDKVYSTLTMMVIEEQEK